MGPEGDDALSVEFTDKLPPIFSGRDKYTSIIVEVLLWLRPTGICSGKRSPDLVGRLSGEANCSFKYISIDECARKKEFRNYSDT